VSRRRARWHGLLPVYKAAGPTSHDVVDMARRALGERRIGHAGTLDPAAEGLLLLCVGQATRLQQFLLRWPKTYEGQIRLGHATTTYDAEGEPSEPAGEPPVLTADDLAALQERFSGEIDQVPPPFSAKKVAGKKLYELARDGQAPEVPAKRVNVHELVLEATCPTLLTVHVVTSTGFYVRTLAHDLGIAIGCGAFLHHLCRAAIGPYTLERAMPQEALENAADSRDVLDHPAWIGMDGVELPFPSLSINRTAAERFTHGQEVIVFRSGGGALSAEQEVTVRGPADHLLGIGVVQAVLARGRTVSVQPQTVIHHGGDGGAAPPPSDAPVAQEETS